MWVEKTKTGKYKYTERYTDYMTGKIRRVSVTMEKNNPSTKKLARQALLRIIEERQNEEPEEVQPLTLWQLVEHYRAYQKQSVKESTYRRNFYQCKALLEILGADVLCQNLPLTSRIYSIISDIQKKTGQKCAGQFPPSFPSRRRGGPVCPPSRTIL